MHTSISAPRLLTFSVALLLAACGGPATAPEETVASTESPSLAKAPPAASTPLVVTVEDTGPQGAYRIQSDGLGDYVHGSLGMTAEIDQYGNLQISPNNLSAPTPPQRTLRFDYSAPADPLNAYRPEATGQWNFKIKSNRTNNGNPRIQDLGLNASGCYNVTIAHATATTTYQENFNPVLDPQSTYGYITRTGLSPATWTMVADGPCAGTPNWSGLWSQDRIARKAPNIFRGYYNRNFSIRLRAK